MTLDINEKLEVITVIASRIQPRESFQAKV